MAEKDRDIFDVRVRRQPSTLVDGELFWGSFRERVEITKRPGWERPVRLFGWMMGRKTLVQTVHLVQDYAHTPLEEYENGHFVDSFVDPVDVSVYGSASAIPAENWPSEDQVSSEEVLKGYNILRKAREERDEVLGL